MHYTIAAALLLSLHLSPASATDTAIEDGRSTGPAGELPRLYNRGEDRLIVMADGRHLSFRPIGARDSSVATRFATAGNDWLLSGARGRYRLTHPDGRMELLDYTGRDGALAPGGSVLQCPVDCDTTSSAAGPAFVGSAGIPGARRVDIRPASCRSYFSDYPPIERGTRIQAALTRQGAMPGLSPTVRSFPHVDWVGDTELIVLHSRDLASSSLDAARRPDALYDRLLADARAVQRGLVDPLERHGTLAVRDGDSETRIDARPARRIVLTLLVRHGLASADQMRQIAAARRDIARLHGFELRVIEIP